MTDSTPLPGSDTPLLTGVVCSGRGLAAENPLKTKAVFAEDMSLTEIGEDTRFPGQALTPFTLARLRHQVQGGKPVERGWYTRGQTARIPTREPAAWLPLPISQLPTGLRPPGKPPSGGGPGGGGYDPRSGPTGANLAT